MEYNTLLDEGIQKLAAQEYNESIEIFTRCIELNPNIHNAYFERSFAKIKLKDFESSLSDLDMAIQLNGTSAVIYLNRAYVRKFLDDFEGSIEDATTSIGIEPHWEALIIRGQSRVNVEDNVHALEDFELAKVMKPNNSLSYCEAGDVRIKNEDWAGALEEFGMALSLDDDDYYRRRLAYAKKQMKDFDGAISDYSLLLQEKPENIDALWGISISSQAANYLERAVVGYRSILELEEGAEWAYFRIFQCILEIYDYDYRETINYCTEKMPQYDGNSEVWNSRGWAKLKHHDYEGAVSDLTICLTYSHSDHIRHIVLNHRGYGYFSLGDYAKALNDYNDSVLLESDYLHGYFNRCRVKLKLGDFNGAKEDYLFSMKNTIKKFQNLLLNIENRNTILEIKKNPTDVKLEVTDVWGIVKIFSCHKDILILQSDMLSSYFHFNSNKNGDAEQTVYQIEIYLSLASFEKLLSYWYCEEPSEFVTIQDAIFIVVWGDSLLPTNYKNTFKACNSLIKQCQWYDTMRDILLEQLADFTPFMLSTMLENELLHSIIDKQLHIHEILDAVK